jgi:hypothetical protein
MTWKSAIKREWRFALLSHELTETPVIGNYPREDSGGFYMSRNFVLQVRDYQ